MTNIKALNPTIVWNYFYEITQIPRPSKKEEKIRAYLIDFAQKNELEYLADEAGNIVIKKSATTGYEERKAIILQSHIDMVCEKNNGIDHDFDNDPITTVIEGEWVTANGTTLGADNGIGMAYALAVLASNDLAHPALECLFTVDEETGLTGAFALSNNLLQGETLINLDSEDDGEIFVGCAGGIDTTVTFNYKSHHTPQGHFAFSVSVKGLKGGHSGDDINKNLGNANKLLNRILWNMHKACPLHLASIDGGNLHNAIPREATATAVIPFEEKEQIRIIFNQVVSAIEDEYGAVETKLRCELHSEDLPETVLSRKSTNRLLNAIYACPNGVMKMSSDLPNLVETSTNLASIKMNAEKQHIKIVTSQRSSVETAKYDIAHQTEAVFQLIKAEISHGDGYPGWNPNLNSPILRIAEQSYERLYDKKPKVRAIHAGLECGLFLTKYPHLDMISIGPQMRGVHSPDEKLHIESTAQSWEWLIDILANAQ